MNQEFYDSLKTALEQTALGAANNGDLELMQKTIICLEWLNEKLSPTPVGIAHCNYAFINSTDKVLAIKNMRAWGGYSLKDANNFINGNLNIQMSKAQFDSLKKYFEDRGIKATLYFDIPQNYGPASAD